MTNVALAYLSAGFGAGIAVLGAGVGIGRLAGAAMEGISRQPNSTNDIRGAMVLAAALIEGVALFAEVICIILTLK
jgi:F-type H+-transporting ATPase subunit c